jgi:hypothetical protein
MDSMLDLPQTRNGRDSLFVADDRFNKLIPRDKEQIGVNKRSNKLASTKYLNDLQGKHTMCNSFNDSDLLPCVADSDLRTNPFQEGEDDMIVDSTEAKALDIVGRITCSRGAKEMDKEACAVIAEGTHQQGALQR